MKDHSTMALLTAYLRDIGIADDLISSVVMGVLIGWGTATKTPQWAGRMLTKIIQEGHQDALAGPNIVDEMIDALNQVAA